MGHDAKQAPTHWIKPTRTAKWPSHYLYLDTEAAREPDGTGERQTFLLAVLAKDTWQQRAGRWAPRRWAEHTDLGMLWDDIDQACPYAHQTVLLAHYTGYDYVISDAPRQLTARGWTLEKEALDREFRFAVWRQGRRSLVIIDLWSFVPKALAEVGKLIGLPKGKLPRPNAPVAEQLAYCRRDVEILATAWRELVDWIGGGGWGGFARTGASLAWNVWRHSFWQHKVLARLPDEIQAAAREAAWSGRREAWRWGDLGPARWQDWDLETAYARLGFFYDVPVGPVGTHRALPVERCREMARHRAVLAVVEVRTSAPTVPCKVAGGIVWPVGHFGTTLWWEEVELAIEAGATVKVKRCWSFQRAPALRGFMAWCMTYTTAAAPDTTPLRATVAKHLSRALVGRCGLRYPEWSKAGPSLGQGLGSWQVYDQTAGTWQTWRDNGRQTDISTGKTEGLDACPQVMSYVMAQLRCHLAHAMLIAGVDHLAHVDTDGLLVDTDGGRRLAKLREWGWRPKGPARPLEVIASGSYVFGELTKLPGIRRGAQRVGPLTWEAEEWSRAASVLSSSDPAAVHVRPVRKTVKPQDARRRHVEGGGTVPFEVELGADGANLIVGLRDATEPQDGR